MFFLAKLASLSGLHTSIQSVFHFNYLGLQGRKNPNNPYQVLEKCKEFGLVHDATTHWVKELNTIFIRVVGKDGTILNVSLSFDRVPGSFTGEALCEELIQKISSVKVLKENATEKLPHALRALRKEFALEIDLKKLHLKKKVCILDIT